MTCLFLGRMDDLKMLRQRRHANIRLTWEAELAWFVRKRATASSTNHDKPLTQVEAIVKPLRREAALFQTPHIRFKSPCKRHKLYENLHSKFYLYLFS